MNRYWFRLAAWVLMIGAVMLLLLNTDDRCFTSTHVPAMCRD